MHHRSSFFAQEYWRRPIFFGMWALYGDFPIDAIYDALGAGSQGYYCLTVVSLSDLFVFTGC